ncbi:glycosyltransferase family 2 protein [Neobacillus sp. MER 74]|uniref:glycosyltransferase family 2 protein n=1 Tax=Neobacillus sp. MER 74 TaxID=2939566 RepID=UPI00203FBC2A|nr:glycosyltransferase family 2 protein [Neobacillus sp. MER 74]MCM3115083.1 glycosyltransferase family 2 protein [Neobacillus sp. MER 74]
MKITVFTSTYNRGYIIEKLYSSLKRQTFKDFEWLVIDDGSTDNTNHLFEKWEKENNQFSIRYYKVENGGKHRAINKGTELATGDLFFIVDSDDYLTENALENVVHWEKSLPRDGKFCGVSGNKGKSDGDFWGTSFIGDYVDATSLERKKYNINGDKAEVFYTKIIKKYKFEEFEGEKFITECTVWDRMAYEGYIIRWFNTTIYICDYLSDGLTKSGDKIFVENPKGTAFLFKQQIKFYNYNLRNRLSHYNAYFKLVKSKINFEQAARNLEVKKITLLFAILLVKCKNLIYRS